MCTILLHITVMHFLQFQSTSIDIKSETSFYSVLIVRIPKWSWILPQIATKINILTFDFLSLEPKIPFGCQKTLA